ncbi:hypothetical protein EVJ50_01150 [Synechococcus sp. RSCCF101]|uniref:hypothetical protein n=1 Tax=Synechococcus sp. RSCCF101 TaxID=2511069 RepID=UPI00124420AC|nr:hypothetical protein [Synechococcus sp. RSCCF101]QEY31064.1 hypothetical protein EVJ50_01150 [Synechococcus sp. RSCCF101]
MAPFFRDLDRPGRRLCSNPWPEVKRRGPKLYKISDLEGNVVMIEATSPTLAMMMASERLGIRPDQLHFSLFSSGPEMM